MKKLLSFILVLTMLISPITGMWVFAAENSKSGTITVEDVYSAPKGTFDVTVSLENNPGIYNLTASFEYDNTAMKLTKVANGTAMSDVASFLAPKNMASGCTATWYYMDEPGNYRDGSLAILTFEILETAVQGKTYPISLKNVNADSADEKQLNISVKSGKVSVINYLPGDVNGDGKHTLRNDVLEFNQYIVDGCKYDPLGYGVQINEEAGDVNDDDRITIKDVILINKYIVDNCITDPDGYNIKLFPHTPRCKHTSLTAVEAKEATCTENGNIAYWVCDECNTLFSDASAEKKISVEETVVKPSHKPGKAATCTEAQTCTECGEVINSAKGHTEVTIPGYAPTYEKPGKTDGVKCSVCGKILAEQKDIPILTPDTLSVTYEIAGTDTYLQSVIASMNANNKVIHSNPNTINTTTSGYTFLNIPSATIPGYTFLGWYDGYADNAVQVKSVAKGQTGAIELYAKWSKNVYTVTFDTPDVDVSYTWYDEAKGVDVTLVNSAKYTVDTGLTIKNPKVFKYTFVGWSNDDGFIVNEIKPGTTGNITLHANWTANRNKATSYSSYDAPIIIEDAENGQFLFVYDIGRIDNVPLYPLKDEKGNVIGANGTSFIRSETCTVTESFTKENTEQITKNIADATTRSSGWTLSEEWNDIYEAGEEYADKKVKSEERTNAEGKTVGGEYFVSNSESGSSYVSTDSGASNSNSSIITTENSKGINGSFDVNTELYCDAKLSAKNETEVSAGVTVPVGIAKASAGVKNTTTIGAEVSNGRKDNFALHVDGSVSSFVGTDKQKNNSSYFNVSANKSSSWNSENAYSNSYSASTNKTVSAAIADEIAKKTSYNIKKTLGSKNSESETVSGTTSSENGYSNTTVSKEYFSKTTTRTISYNHDEVGYYRIVEAGTVHVYGVVGYDIATTSYFVYTYNVLEDDTFEYLDYSLERATFDDCENELVTFRIPYEVNEYVLAMTGKSDGLEFNEGTVNKFETPQNFDGTVVIPQYYSEDNGNKTNSAHKVIAFNWETFRGNTDIKTVILPIYIKEIPYGAFEGCTNLETVIAYGVTSIGENAFKGCTSLKTFAIDNKVTYLGNNAFEGVSAIEVMAANADVADAAIKSGAKSVTVNLTKLTDSYNSKKIMISDTTDYFALISDGKTYSDLTIESDSAETFISNMTFTDNKDIPLKIHSPVVTLARVTVQNAPGFALILDAENVDLKLLGSVNLSSTVNNTVLSKNVTLSKSNPSVSGKLNISGKYFVNGTITNTGMVNATSVETIDEATFNSYLSAVIVTFNANGGNISETTKSINYGQRLSELPTPTKSGYSFVDWYTDESCQTAFDINTAITSNITLYAKWLSNLPGKPALSINKTEFNTGDTISCEWNNVENADCYEFHIYNTNSGERVYVEWTLTGTKHSTAINTPGSYKVYIAAINNERRSSGLEDYYNCSNDVYFNVHGGSGWVSPSEVPSWATVTDRKYTYTKTYYTTSNSSSMSGWTHYDTSSAWSDYGAWSAWQDGAVSASDSRDVATQEVVSGYNKKTQYFYSRYRSNDSKLCTPMASGVCLTYEDTGWLDHSLPVYQQNPKYYYNDGYYTHYGYRYNPSTDAYNGKYLYWFKETTRQIDDTNSPIYKTQYRYRDRSLIYTYYFRRSEDLESSGYPSGDNISDVVEWVQYRAK